VESFCAAIARRYALPQQEQEDLIAWLIAITWELSLRYDGSQGSRFSAYARHVLVRRAPDWRRQRDGRTVWKFKDHTYERPRPEFVSVDSESGARLVDALSARGGDSPTDRDTDGGGLFGDRDRARARDLETLGLRPH
jgi:hypothetical protein